MFKRWFKLWHIDLVAYAAIKIIFQNKYIHRGLEGKDLKIHIYSTLPVLKSYT